MTNKTDQRDAFSENEGDKYYARNKKGLDEISAGRRLVIDRIAHHLPSTKRTDVLEIGCASGNNLAALAGLKPIAAFGIEPSKEAVRAGKGSLPNFNLFVGTADILPFEDDSMDVVWFAFCLYLVDRTLLHRVVAEADRVLKDGGMVVVHDFDPAVPNVRPYSHRPGINSYKMDYSGLFLCDPAYSLVEKLSFTQQGIEWTSDAQQRLALWICRKNIELGYRHSSDA